MFRQAIYDTIFEADTPSGLVFDVVLIICIILSVTVVLLDSVAAYRANYGQLFFMLEWTFTGLFTLEYGLRIYAARRPLRYMTSFYGVIDLLSILPTYMALVVANTHYLAVIRILRVLRVFRVLKLAHYLKEYDFLVKSLAASRRKILVFLSSVVVLVVILGSVIYIVEPSEAGFTSIPRSIYWAIVTLTTVGYGDISPTTVFGQFIAGTVMILGYAIIAVPAGLVTTEMMSIKSSNNSQVCSNCLKEGHDDDAVFCKYCGNSLKD